MNISFGAVSAKCDLISDSLRIPLKVEELLNNGSEWTVHSDDELVIVFSLHSNPSSLDGE